MSVSCSCPENDIMSVGDPREVTCRTPRRCTACGASIEAEDRMYRWSMYDFGGCVTVAPLFLCEECGDMSLNLVAQDYCFDFGTGIRDQWLEYLDETDPTNPALQ